MTNLNNVIAATVSSLDFFLEGKPENLNYAASTVLAQEAEIVEETIATVEVLLAALKAYAEQVARVNDERGKVQP